VAVIVVDEDEKGLPVVEKWHIKKNTTYFGKKEVDSYKV